MTRTAYALALAVTLVAGADSFATTRATLSF
jgi:hypothetical protein